MTLDPDDSRPPYQQVASHLKAAILTGKYDAGGQLPTQDALADMYEVSRPTIQSALRVLREEGLTVSRQGQGIFVKNRQIRPIGLQPHLAAAFKTPTVSLDFAGFTTETMHGALTAPLDQIRDGTSPTRSINMRLLTCDVTEASLPAVDGDGDRSALIQRAEMLTKRHSQALTESVNELVDLGLIDHGKVHVRKIHSCPLFKCIIVNNADLFFGLYPVVTHNMPSRNGKLKVHDAMGKDAALFHKSTDSDQERQYVEEFGRWFDSVWRTVAKDVNFE